MNAFAGGLDMPHSGPYTTMVWDQNQKIFDLREDWWAIKAGLAKLPDVKRIVMTNIGGQVGQNMDTVAQRVVNNEYDTTLDMRSSVIGNILKQNPKVTTHYRQQVAVRVSGLVAELAVDQHPACALQRSERAPRHEPGDRP